MENLEVKKKTWISIVILTFSLLSTQILDGARAEDNSPVEALPPIWTPGMTDDSGQLVPPPLFNRDGTPFENREQFTREIPQRTTTWFPGMRDGNGLEIPAPLYNLDGTIYVEGVSPRPQIPIYNGEDVAEGSQTLESVLSQTIDWYPGIQDRNGNEIPAPIFNPDGSPYIEGVSPRPKLPVYSESSITNAVFLQSELTEKSLIRKVNSEIKSSDVNIQKSNSTYLLTFSSDISALDSSLYLTAINKKTKKSMRIPLAIDYLGQAIAVTDVNLKKYRVFIKRGQKTLNEVNLSSNL